MDNWKNDPGKLFGLFAEVKKASNETMALSQGNIQKTYKKFKSKEEKDKLIEKYIYIVHQCVRRIGMFLPSHVEQDDLLSEGVIGLIDAVEKFNPEKGADFATYATMRVRGTIIDSLRQKDWVPRNIRDLSKEIEKAKNQLENENKRTPTQEELSSHLGITPNKLSYYINKIKNAEVVSLDEMVRMTGSTESNLSHSIKDEGVDIEGEIEKKERIGILKEAIQKLNHREKLILSLYYNEELSLKEIQQVLGISMPRISQIHKKVLKKLKDTLKENKDLLVS